MSDLVRYEPASPAERLEADTVIACCPDCGGRFLHIWVPPCDS